MDYTEIQETEQQQQAVETTPVETVPLNQVLASIRDDAQQSPEAYLDETVVPFGGE